MAPRSTAFLGLAITLSLLCLIAVNGCGDTSCSNPPPPPPPAVPTPSGGTCPINVLDLAVCADVLQYVLKISSDVPSSQCCTLIQGLVDVDAALCLRTAIKANVLGVINLDVTADVTLVLNICNKTCPPCFTCPL